ncbi:MAG: glutamate racemase [Nevskiaceae bacterium]|jgi:glutamate racemase|nr:MAG: glutamate racemase [Nevskiaceae bacterium]TAM26662.1 MAG: glutamate racemase [Nevskiaceae bacterium]
MSIAPIGVFDSGLGGITVLKELVQRLPQEDFLYIADSGHCPYGGKSADEITARARAVTEALLARGAKLIVVACNTATIAAIETLRAEYPVSFVGMEPAVKPAAARTYSGVIGVLATGAALAGEKLHKLIREHAGGVRVITQPCPGLVERVELGDLNGPQTRALVEEYTAPLLAAGADVLVLGCTHYPFLRPLVAEVVGPRIAILDTGEAVARRTEALLQAEGLLVVSPLPGKVQWFSTGDADAMAIIASRLWGKTVQVEALSD